MLPARPLCVSRERPRTDEARRVAPLAAPPHARTARPRRRGDASEIVRRDGRNSARCDRALLDVHRSVHIIWRCDKGWKPRPPVTAKAMAIEAGETALSKAAARGLQTADRSIPLVQHRSLHEKKCNGHAGSRGRDQATF